MDTALLEAAPTKPHSASLSNLRRVVEQLMEEWERFPGPLSHFTIVGVRDADRDRYTLLQLSRPHGLQVAHTLAHLEIKGGKIHIEADATEEGIGNELVAAGIPKSQIVLAFYPPEIREMGDFAVS